LKNCELLKQSAFLVITVSMINLKTFLSNFIECKYQTQL
jgi:hypothetical protein